MSKIGKMPVEIPDGVTVAVDGNLISVKGPKGELSQRIPRGLLVEIDKNKKVIVSNNKDGKQYKSLHGTFRSIISNMVKGVSEGWKKELELVGAGYRAEVSQDDLVLTVGFSHPVKIKAPKDISFNVEKSIIRVEGIDKEVVGLIASRIRSVRPPEPYKGKGIKYTDEIIRRKAGKAAKTMGTGA